MGNCSLTDEEKKSLEKAVKIISACVERGELSSQDGQCFERIAGSMIEDRENKKTLLSSADAQSALKMEKEIDRYPTSSSDLENLFQAVPYHDGVAIHRYIGFEEEHIHIPEMILGKTVYAINEKAFFGARHIKTVTMPDSILYIGDSCFEECENLSEIHLSNQIKVIGKYAFRRSGITRIDMPESLFCAGRGSFAETKLETVTLSKSLTCISPGMFYRCYYLKHIDIPEGISRLCDASFSWCSDLCQVSLPNGLLELGHECFFHCSSLKVLDLPDTIQSINKYTFSRFREDNKLITIRCNPGTAAQQLARENGFVVERTDKVYSKKDLSPGYIYTAMLLIDHHLATVNNTVPLDQAGERKILNLLMSIDQTCDYLKTDDYTICFKSSSAGFEKSHNLFRVRDGIEVHRIY